MPLFHQLRDGVLRSSVLVDVFVRLVQHPQQRGLVGKLESRVWPCSAPNRASEAQVSKSHREGCEQKGTVKVHHTCSAMPLW